MSRGLNTKTSTHKVDPGSDFPVVFHLNDGHCHSTLIKQVSFVGSNG